MSKKTKARAQARTAADAIADAKTANAAGNAIVGSEIPLDPHAHTVKARASLAIRVIMAIVAVAALVFAVLAGLNISASTRFNQATASLNRNLKQATQDDADLDALNASQQQTDAQFEDAARLNIALLPQLRQAIAANATVSAELTKRIGQELAAQQGTNTNNGNGGSAEIEGATTKDSKNSNGSGLTDEQKKQVEELLKANQQSTDTNPSTNTQTDKANKKQQTAKPW